MAPEGSKKYTMHLISESGPYHAVILVAGTIDTSGGPVINERAQVIDVTGSRSRAFTERATASPPRPPAPIGEEARL